MRTQATGGTSRALTPAPLSQRSAAGGPGHTPAGPGKGQSWAEVVSDAAAQRPAHWPSIRPSPSPAASRLNPEGILPRPFTPRSQSCGCPNSSGLVTEARGLGRRPGAEEEAAAGAGGLRGAGRRPEERGAFPSMTPLTGL